MTDLQIIRLSTCIENKSPKTYSKQETEPALVVLISTIQGKKSNCFSSFEFCNTQNFGK